jgi:hypothetical protein
LQSVAVGGGPAPTGDPDPTTEEQISGELAKCEAALAKLQTSKKT